jgi:hypothetical protein
MPSRPSQHRRRTHHRTTYLGEEHMTTPAEVASNSLDPTLFSLVTTLPMSCFPTDNVHPSAQYGLAGDNDFSISQLAPCGSTPWDDNMLFLPSTRNQCSSSYERSEDDFFDLVPPLSASTMSSESSLNRFSDDFVEDFGSARAFHAVLLSNADTGSYLPRSCLQAPCGSDFLLKSLDSVAQDLPEYSWNELEPPNILAAGTQQQFQLDQSQMPWNPLVPETIVGSSDSISFDVPVAPEDIYLPTPMTSPESYSLLQQSAHTSTEDPLPDYASDNVDKQVDDFLDELANVIDWESIEHTFEAPDTAANSDFTKSMNHTEIPQPDQHAHDSFDLPIAAYFQEGWQYEFLGDAELSPNFFDLLDEQNFCPLNPDNLDS